MIARVPGIWLALTVACATACGDGDETTGPPDPADCRGLGPDDVLTLGVTASDDEVLLSVPARALSTTSWALAGQEALILDVAADEAPIGQLILHQGARSFDYTMALGRLGAGQTVTATLSPLSAALEGEDPRACLADAQLTPGAALGPAAAGLAHAPIFVWPVTKRFDDVPLVLGWSAATRGFEVIYSNENGGTTALCGDPVTGMELLYARWGRGFDVERISSYEPDGWLRCTGFATFDQVAPRLEGAHPILYYGDGHNRLFEDRSGYGGMCGRGPAERADGMLAGWNEENPGNAPADDAPFVITLRPAPLPLDPLGYDVSSGRREGLADRVAPWIYRLTADELAREGKLDGTQVRPLDGYLYVDVRAAGVDGVGSEVCGNPATLGFRLGVNADDPDAPGSTLAVPGVRTSGTYVRDGQWKRLAIPLPDGVTSAGITALVFDALEGDGVTLEALGDAFRVVPTADGGVELDPVLTGTTSVGTYVVDDGVGCVEGTYPDGPAGPIPCATSVLEIIP